MTHQSGKILLEDPWISLLLLIHILDDQSSLSDHSFIHPRLVGRVSNVEASFSLWTAAQSLTGCCESNPVQNCATFGHGSFHTPASVDHHTTAGTKQRITRMCQSSSAAIRPATCRQRTTRAARGMWWHLLLVLWLLLLTTTTRAAPGTTTVLPHHGDQTKHQHHVQPQPKQPPQPAGTVHQAGPIRPQPLPQQGEKRGVVQGETPPAAATTTVEKVQQQPQEVPVALHETVRNDTKFKKAPTQQHSEGGTDTNNHILPQGQNNPQEMKETKVFVEKDVSQENESLVVVVSNQSTNQEAQLEVATTLQAEPVAAIQSGQETTKTNTDKNKLQKQQAVLRKLAKRKQKLQRKANEKAKLLQESQQTVSCRISRVVSNGTNNHLSCHSSPSFVSYWNGRDSSLFLLGSACIYNVVRLSYRTIGRSTRKPCSYNSPSKP